MREFDEVLKKALMEANLMEYGPIWKTAAEPSFSSHYMQNRRRLLADPARWRRQRGRSLWRRMARTALCAAVICALLMGGAMAASPSIRMAVLGWLREISSDGQRISYVSQGERRTYEEPPRWRPIWLPEGWALDRVTVTGEENDACDWIYRHGEEELTFSCAYPVQAKIDTLQPGTAVAVSGDVNGFQADFYAGADGGLLVWENEEGVLFQLRGPLSQVELERIGESVAEPAAESLPVYRLGWLPEGCGAPYARSALREAVSEQFLLADGTLCVWTYATASVCPLAVPGGTPETVVLDGAEGWYWAPGEETGGGISVTREDGGDMPLLTGGSEAILLWTGGDGITFRVQGNLELDTLLQIAEGVRCDG